MADEQSTSARDERKDAEPTVRESPPPLAAVHYVQSQRGTLVARLIDGEPREAWELGDADEEQRVREGLMRDAYRARARVLLETVADLFEVGTGAELERIENATRVLQGLPERRDDGRATKERLAWYLETIELFKKQLQGGVLEVMQTPGNHFFQLSRAHLATYHCEAFARLDVEFLEMRLKAMDLQSTGNTPGLDGVATELAMSVNAFGFDEGSASREKKMKRGINRLYNARSTVKNRGSGV